MPLGRRPIEIANRQRRARPRRGDIRRLIDRILDAEGEGRGLSVVFVGERTVRRLHRDWFGLDSVTDVLSFPSGGSSAGMSMDEASIGEVIICPSVCEESARRGNLPLHDEIARMLVHGTLHLLGYDHATERQARRMQPRQRRYLAWYRRNGLEAMEPW